MLRDLRPFPVLFLSGIISLLLWAAFISLSRGWFPSLPPPFDRWQSGFFYDLPNRQMPTAWAVAFLTLLWAIVWFTLHRLNTTPTPATRRDLFLLLSFAFLFRILLWTSVPVHENDFYRYLWDGKVINAGINPFLY
ncbi:MAG: hypothetical protein AAGJ31_10640, partial [Verrucomicrobiota bacterium]